MITKASHSFLVLSVVLLGGVFDTWALGVGDGVPSIAVGGNANVCVVPDNVEILFGIETKDMDIAVAKKKNVDIMNLAVAAIAECSVTPGDIQTDQLSVTPDWQREWGTGNSNETLKGYFVRNSIQVQLREPARTEELISKCIAVGVNYVHGLEFRTTEADKYSEQTRELALKKARDKAEKMAAVLGKSVGQPLTISESYVSSGQRRSILPSWGHDSGGIGIVHYQQSLIDGATPQGTSQMVALGKISIESAVQVVFELK